MKLKTVFKKVFNRLTKEYGTDEVPLSIMHKHIREEGFEVTEQELEDFIANNPDVLK